MHDVSLAPNRRPGGTEDPDDPKEPVDPIDNDEQPPETPLDEPRPPRVEDPPAEATQKGPYVVEG
jgi:hypothetical protein